MNNDNRSKISSQEDDDEGQEEVPANVEPPRFIAGISALTDDIEQPPLPEDDPLLQKTIAPLPSAPMGGATKTDSKDPADSGLNFFAKDQLLEKDENANEHPTTTEQTQGLLQVGSVKFGTPQEEETATTDDPNKTEETATPDIPTAAVDAVPPALSSLRRQERQVTNQIPGAYAFGTGVNGNQQPPVNDGTSQQEGGVAVIEAFRVPASQAEDQERIEEEVRQRILNEAVQAQAVEPVEGGSDDKSLSALCRRKWKALVVLVLFLLAILGLGLGFGISNTRKNSNKEEESGTEVGSASSSATTSGGIDASSDIVNGGNSTSDTESSSDIQQQSPSHQSSLAHIIDRGYIKCGIYLNVAGFGFQNGTTGEYSGFNFQICRAIAAALFDDGDQYQIEKISATHRFQNLSQGSVDLISQTVTQTMGRDVMEVSSSAGFSFSYPFYFSGTTFGGIPEFVKCADKLDPFNGICRGLKVCITIGSTQERVVNDLLPGPVAVRFFNPVDSIGFFNNGTCNVIAAEPILMIPSRLYNDFGLDKNLPFVVGNNTFSRDPLSIITPDGDVEWSDMVNSVIKILYTTEKMNVTRDNVQTYQFDPQLSPELQERIRRVVSTVGNMGELYEYATQAVMPRHTINTQNTNFDTGLMYAYPFGRTETLGPPSGMTSPTMDLIQERGYLKCGSSSTNRGLLTSSLDLEICRAIGGALFLGDPSQVELVDDLDQPFVALEKGTVDVLVGQQVTLSSEFLEPTTNKSFAFSTPYFYGSNGTMLALVTRREDNLWSSFVIWMNQAIVYAEEEGISFSNAIEMPIVNLFGLAYAQSFRDCIASVGNYADIYERTLGPQWPRSGGNLLNTVPFEPQQVAYPLL